MGSAYMIDFLMITMQYDSVNCNVANVFDDARGYRALHGESWKQFADLFSHIDNLQEKTVLVAYNNKNVSNIIIVGSRKIPLLKISKVKSNNVKGII